MNLNHYHSTRNTPIEHKKRPFARLGSRAAKVFYSRRKKKTEGTKLNLPGWIVDIRGKKSFRCPHCGELIKVQPRQISTETLKHMQTIRQLGKIRKKTTAKGIGAFKNARACICMSCGKPVICFDEFTTIIEPKEKTEKKKRAPPG
jgi:DNA-directed RNA polymerase subunit RPC12/RpoP